MEKINHLSSKNQNFILAAGAGNLLLVKELFSKGANIDVLDYSPMIWASCYGKINTLKFLIEAGSNIHAQNDYLITWTCSNGNLNDNLQILDYLLTIPKINIHVNNSEPIKKASQYGHIQIVKKLLQFGADPQFIFNNGNTNVKHFIQNTVFLEKKLQQTLNHNDSLEKFFKI